MTRSDRFEMATLWQPSMSIAEFIAYRQKHPQPREERPPSIFRRTADGATTETVFQAPYETSRVKQSLSLIITYQARGDLETQQSLLLQLARLENRAKGFGEAYAFPLPTDYGLCLSEWELKKRELQVALNMIWTRRRKS